MLKKYQAVGKSLSKAEMKTIKGGIIWPYLRIFGCTNGFFHEEGCTDSSIFGSNCCKSKYGPTSSAIWYEPYEPCTVQACGSA